MIHARELVKRHGKVTILKGIDLTIERGEVAVLIGPSGSGKSTLLRCLNGLEEFHSGRITVDDLTVTADCSAKRKAALHHKIRLKLGMVFQSFNLFPHLTVMGNVIEAPRTVLGLSREEAEARAKPLLDRVGMLGHAHKRPTALSGGQQQRIAIARALAMKPEAMLFDEPTSALDPKMTAEVLSVMADLARDGLTMVIVTHAMEFARQAATTVHVLDSGRLIESAPPERLFTSPSHEATRGLLAQVRAA